MALKEIAALALAEDAALNQSGKPLLSLLTPVLDYGTSEGARKGWLTRRRAVQCIKVSTSPRSFAGVREKLTALVGKELHSADGLPATISGNSKEKILSGKAANKSISLQAHLAAAESVEELFSNAICKTKEPGNKPNVKWMYRLLAPFMFGDRPLQAKISVKEFDDGTENRLYTIEAMEIENPEGNLASDIS